MREKKLPLWLALPLMAVLAYSAWGATVYIAANVWHAVEESRCPVDKITSVVGTKPND